VTQDIHPFTALTDLLRLGLVTVKTVKGQELIVPHQEGFVPPPGSRDLLDLFGANLSDHAAAACRQFAGAAAPARAKRVRRGRDARIVLEN
jgi:hypothetical protein